MKTLSRSIVGALFIYTSASGGLLSAQEIDNAACDLDNTTNQIVVTPEQRVEKQSGDTDTITHVLYCVNGEVEQFDYQLAESNLLYVLDILNTSFDDISLSDIPVTIDPKRSRNTALFSREQQTGKLELSLQTLLDLSSEDLTARDSALFSVLEEVIHFVDQSVHNDIYDSIEQAGIAVDLDNAIRESFLEINMLNLLSILKSRGYFQDVGELQINRTEQIGLDGTDGVINSLAISPENTTVNRVSTFSVASQGYANRFILNSFYQPIVIDSDSQFTDIFFQQLEYLDFVLEMLQNPSVTNFDVSLVNYLGVENFFEVAQDMRDEASEAGVLSRNTTPTGEAIFNFGGQGLDPVVFVNVSHESVLSGEGTILISENGLDVITIAPGEELLIPGGTPLQIFSTEPVRFVQEQMPHYPLLNTDMDPETVQAAIAFAEKRQGWVYETTGIFITPTTASDPDITTESGSFNVISPSTLWMQEQREVYGALVFDGSETFISQEDLVNYNIGNTSIITNGMFSEEAITFETGDMIPGTNLVVSQSDVDAAAPRLSFSFNNLDPDVVRSIMDTIITVDEISTINYEEIEEIGLSVLASENAGYRLSLPIKVRSGVNSVNLQPQINIRNGDVSVRFNIPNEDQFFIRLDPVTASSIIDLIEQLIFPE